MTIDQIIALFASVGACLSATATFLTVRQIAKQREASYRPDITLSRMYFEGSKSPLRQGLMPTYWFVKAGIVESDVTLSQFAIPIRNVGLGAAKHVVVSWTFPFDTAVKNVNELAQRTLTPAYFTFDGSTLSLESESLGETVSYWRNQQQESLDYVLSAAVQKEPAMLSLPNAYVEIISAMILLSGRLKDPRSFPEIPPLSVTIDFFDIAEQKHAAAFEITFELHSMSSNGESFHAGILPKKIM